MLQGMAKRGFFPQVCIQLCVDGEKDGRSQEEEKIRQDGE